jgi:hypothetical protein
VVSRKYDPSDISGRMGAFALCDQSPGPGFVSSDARSEFVSSTLRRCLSCVLVMIGHSVPSSAVLTSRLEGSAADVVFMVPAISADGSEDLMNATSEPRGNVATESRSTS